MASTPRYRRQKSKTGADQAFVELGSTRHYLGRFNSPESKEAYGRLVAEFASAGGTPIEQTELTVIELVGKYWEHANRYYTKDGGRTGEAGLVRLTLRPVVKLYGRLPTIDRGCTKAWPLPEDVKTRSDEAKQWTKDQH